MKILKESSQTFVDWDKLISVDSSLEKAYQENEFNIVIRDNHYYFDDVKNPVRIKKAKHAMSIVYPKVSYLGH